MELMTCGDDLGNFHCCGSLVIVDLTHHKKLSLLRRSYLIGRKVKDCGSPNAIRKVTIFELEPLNGARLLNLNQHSSMLICPQEVFVSLLKSKIEAPFDSAGVGSVWPLTSASELAKY